MSDTKERTAQETARINEAYDFLQKQIDLQGVPVHLIKESGRLLPRQVCFGAYVGGAFDAYDKVQLLIKIEETWNSREPEPAYIITLDPATVPPHDLK